MYARLWSSLICGVVFAASAPAASPELPAFYDGVHEIAAPGVPGPLSVFGDQAFVVVTGKADGAVVEPVIAAAPFGNGRVVAFGHDGYFDDASVRAGQTARFIANAIRWASGQKPNPVVAVLEDPAIQGALSAAGITTAYSTLASLAQVDVVIARYAVRDDASVAAVREFVMRGGGLLLASPVGWGWKQLNPAGDLAVDHPGNKLLAEAGIVWTDGYLSPTSGTFFAVGAAPADLAHAGTCVMTVRDASLRGPGISASDLLQIEAVLTHLLIAVPPSDQVILPSLYSLLDLPSTPVPSEATPVDRYNLIGRLGIAAVTQSSKRNPALARQPHPAAAVFPGSVPAGAQIVTASITIPRGRSGWISTGLYAPPGAAVSVRVPDGTAARRCSVRIGAHSDQLWHLDSWQRMPEITTSASIATEHTETANPFGGPVYIEVPGDQDDFVATISGAVAAPHFTLGTTDLSEWRTSIRNRPAPWAELEGRHIVLVLPTATIRTLEDPITLLNFWDTAVALQDELAGAPNPRTRKERVVTDQQISAGYMHAGYPIMTWLDVAPAFANVNQMREGGEASWGIFHELGHNHQESAWTFDGTTEVTVNIFTLYLFDKLLGIPVDQTTKIGMAARARYVGDYFRRPSFDVWKSDPFLALTMYAQLIVEHGWEPFHRVFREYLSLPDFARPVTDADKRDEWMVRFSRTIGRNLGPFFDAWAVPVSSGAKEMIRQYPVWIPAELPVSPPRINPPEISRGGMVGVAGSVPPITKIAPGTLFSIYGSDFVPAGVGRRANLDEIRDDKLPTMLLGVCVIVSGRRAPMLDVFPTQINAVVPDVEPGTETSVQVITACDTLGALQSSAQTVSVARVAPEFLYFTLNTDGKNPVAAANAVTGTYLGPTDVLGGALSPAHPGDLVTIYAVGFGPADPPIAAGTIAPGAAKTVATAVVRLGDHILPDSDILYVGAAPGQVISQLNIRLPANTPAGNLPLQITLDGVPSPAGPFLAVSR